MIVKNKELMQKYNPEGSDLRRAQKRMLEMLIFIDEFCTNNDITYWLDAGTLLGAARHGGFIPWDDDTDICMPLKDMLKFKKLMLEESPSDKYIVHCHEIDKAYFRSQWIVLRDLNSEYIQDSNFHNSLKYKGLQVDIFPLEKDVPLLLKQIVDQIQQRFIIQPSLSDKWFYRILKPMRSISWYVINGFIIPITRCFKKRNNYYNMAYGIPFYHKRYISNIYPLTRIQFEGHFFNAPNKVDAFLTDLYGNWRKIPTENEIHTHNVKINFY